jgi:hypothetical protein
MKGNGDQPVDVALCEPEIPQAVQYKEETEFVASSRRSAVTAGMGGRERVLPPDLGVHGERGCRSQWVKARIPVVRTGDAGREDGGERSSRRRAMGKYVQIGDLKRSPLRWE